MKALFVTGCQVINGRVTCAGWIEGIAKKTQESIGLVFACPSEVTEVEKNNTADCSGTTVNVVFFDEHAQVDAFLEIYKTVQPSGIVVFGTENQRSLNAMEAAYLLGLQKKTCVFSQGFCCACGRNYSLGLPDSVIHRWTFRDIIRRDNISSQIQGFKKREKFEKEVLGKAFNLIGRTTFDYAIYRAYNNFGNYHHCNDVLREGFYRHSWDIHNHQKHKILVSQYYYPLKGFHILLEAVSIIKDKYPDIEIVATGYNPIKKDVRTKELKDSSYIRYIKKLVIDCGLEKNVRFVGELDCDGMIEHYLTSHVFVLPSTVENSPNSLAEAMIMGVPCIASNVGGVSDLATHNIDAILYPANDIYLLSHYLDLVMSNDDLAERISNNAKINAGKLYNRETNCNRFMEIIKTISDYN